jgi:hypothetical protein
MKWKIHTPNLLKEILSNPTANILERPLNIFGKILYEVAERAAELNDPQLNSLMCRLTLYEQADPEMPSYDQTLIKGVVL